MTDGGATRRPPSRSHLIRRRTILLLVFCVAGAVLVESWHAAMNAAATGGRPWPWLWPVTLEAFMAVLILVYWDARSVGRRAWTARVFLFVTTAVASAVQVLDAPGSWLGWLTAGWTPVALLLSVEFAVGYLYRPDWPIPVPVPETPAPEDAPPAPPSGPVQPVPAPTYRDTAPERAKTRGGPSKTSTERTRAFRERERAKKAALTTSRNGDGS